MKLHYIIILLLFICQGCTQKINANVSATVEQGYSSSGKSVSIVALPYINKDLKLNPDLQIQLEQNLSKLGYSINKEPSKSNIPQVVVRYYWQSFGPYVSYQENPLWDFGDSRRGPWQRPRVIKEEKYLRTLIIEAWANKLAEGEEVNNNGLAPFLQQGLSYKEAISYLPKEPARLLWRVEAKSLGNLSSADKILTELFQSAMPWMARSVDTRVLVQGDDISQTSPTDAIMLTSP